MRTRPEHIADIPPPQTKEAAIAELRRILTLWLQAGMDAKAGSAVMEMLDLSERHAGPAIMAFIERKSGLELKRIQP